MDRTRLQRCLHRTVSKPPQSPWVATPRLRATLLGVRVREVPNNAALDRPPHWGGQTGTSALPKPPHSPWVATPRLRGDVVGGSGAGPRSAQQRRPRSTPRWGGQTGPPNSTPNPCAAFGINAGTTQVHVDYWLVDAPDSILTESHRNPDGTGIGWFAQGPTAHIDKQPVSAFTDSGFSGDAKTVTARTLITHIRAATTGHDALENTHPFVVDGLVVAHNGGFGDLPAVQAQLGDLMHQVHGDTDSERYAA